MRLSEWDTGRRGVRLCAFVVVMAMGALLAGIQALAVDASSKAMSCTGAFSGTAQALTVPEGATCTLEAGARVVKNVDVASGGTLSDKGAKIGGNLKAVDPAGIQLGGSTLTQISKNVRITGLMGSPEEGGNFVCNTKIGGSLVYEGATASAARILIGGPPSCEADHISKSLRLRGDAVEVDVSSSSIGQNLEVEGNTAGVNVSGNHASKKLTVKNNSGGVHVSNNSAGQNATCEGNMPSTEGEGNTAHRGNSCPA